MPTSKLGDIPAKAMPILIQCNFQIRRRLTVLDIGLRDGSPRSASMLDTN
jgi:hypothetical protein